MSRTSSFRPKEYAKRKRRHHLVLASICLAVLLLLVGLASFILHRQSLRISHVELSGGILLTEQDVQAEVLQDMSGSYLWLFPKNSTFLYPHDSIVRDLKSHFQRIETVTVSLKNFRTLVVTVTERKPVALWCKGTPGDTDSPDCYFMDDNGTIFSEAPYFSGDAYFKYYTQSNPVANSTASSTATTTSDTLGDVSFPIGKDYIASSTLFTAISHFVSIARDLSLHPQYLVAGDNNEFDLVIGGGGHIYFDIHDPLSKTEDNLRALLRTPALSSTSAMNLPVEYIDLRFGNKLFYKLKQ